MNRFLYVLSALIAIVGIARLYVEHQNSQVSSLLGSRVDIDSKILIDGRTPIVGGSEAKVKFVEFMDYECGPCRSEWGRLRRISQINGHALYIRHFPLREIHKLAEKAALVALASSPADQLITHEWLIDKPLSNEMLSHAWSKISKSNLDHAAMLLNEDERVADRVGISHTPTLFAIFNGQVFEVRNWSLLENL